MQKAGKKDNGTKWNSNCVLNDRCYDAVKKLRRVIDHLWLCRTQQYQCRPHIYWYFQETGMKV